MLWVFATLYQQQHKSTQLCTLSVHSFPLPLFVFCPVFLFHILTHRKVCESAGGWCQQGCMPTHSNAYYAHPPTSTLTTLFCSLFLTHLHARTHKSVPESDGGSCQQQPTAHPPISTLTLSCYYVFLTQTHKLLVTHIHTWTHRSMSESAGGGCQHRCSPPTHSAL